MISLVGRDVHRPGAKAPMNCRIPLIEWCLHVLGGSRPEPVTELNSRPKPSLTERGEHWQGRPSPSWRKWKPSTTPFRETPPGGHEAPFNGPKPLTPTSPPATSTRAGPKPLYRQTPMKGQALTDFCSEPQKDPIRDARASASLLGRSDSTLR